MKISAIIFIAAVTACATIYLYNNPQIILQFQEPITQLLSDNAFLFPYIFESLQFMSFLSAIFSTFYVYSSMRKVFRFARTLGYVTQSLGMTDNSAGVHVTSSENDASTIVTDTTSKSINNTLQTQVAPSVGEISTLSTEIFTSHYSTPMYMGSFPVSAAAFSGSNVCFILSNAIYTNNNIKRLFIDKRFASFDLRFTINVTGNPFASGTLIFASVPCPLYIPTSAITQDPSINNPWLFPLRRITSLDHAVVDLSVDGVYTIDMPYTHFASYLSWSDYTTIPEYAALWGVILAPYIPPTGFTASLNFEVYATVMNLKTIESAPYYSQSLFSIGGSTTTNYQISDIRDSSLPLNVSGDHLSATVDDSVGLDNPSIPSNPASFLRTVYQKLTSWKNVVDVNRMSGEPERIVTMTEPICKDLRLNVDEMSMDFYKTRWAYVANFQIAAQPANTCVFTMPIAPFTGETVVTGAPASSFNMPATFMDPLVGASLLWRGSLKYRFILASNSFKRGKLIVAIHYGDNALVPTGAVVPGSLDPRSLPHIVVDFSNTDRIIDVDVPYKAIYEFLRCRDLTTKQVDCKPWNEFFMGSIAVYVASPISPSNGTSPIINISVFNQLGQDFNFCNEAAINTGGFFSESKLTPPSLMNSIETRLNHVTCLSSLKELLLRPVPYGNFTLATNGTNVGYGANPLMIPVHPQFLSTSGPWSFAMNAYCGMRGGWRLIVRYFDSNNNGQVRLSYLPYYKPTDVTGANASTNPFGLHSIYANTLSTTTSTIGTYPGPGTNYIAELMTTQLQAAYTTPSSLAGGGFTNGVYNTKDTILDSNSQPEAIIEFPDSSPLYRTQPCGFAMPSFYTFRQTAGKYAITGDRNVPWLVASLLDTVTNTTVPIPDPPHIVISTYFQAADDIRFFWYNGGPNLGNPVYNVTSPTAGTFLTVMDGAK
jgi:hypothetical protein